MDSFYRKIKAFTHPISLSTIYLIIIAFYSFRGILSIFGYSAFVLIVLLMNIAIIAILLKNFLKRKNPLIPNLVAYVIWLLPLIIEYFLYKPLIYKLDFIEFLLSLIGDGLIVIIIYSLTDLELNLLALGGFSAFLFVFSLEGVFYFWVLVVTVFISGVYAGLLFKKTKITLAQILISYLGGAVVYAIVYYLAFYAMKMIYG